ncbi:hypothetical protein SAMN05443144_12070 [Fodinibius roseus]|uniref:Uncharacterized protein n=1 Tax=Fodinibius roseus TaxID=1194090 RepID=A0A1M5HKH7_9BACT|nr:hypothetical protein SAMN05443144_12070 [Fodinibius roseus]
MAFQTLMQVWLSGYVRNFMPGATVTEILKTDYTKTNC